MSPVTVKGTTRRNWLPNAWDAALWYQAAKSALTLTWTSVVARFAPALGVKRKLAEVTARVLENPTTATSNPDEVREEISTREMRGGRRWIVSVRLAAEVPSIIASIRTMPATVPVWMPRLVPPPVKTARVAPTAIEKLTERPPREN